jgi:hypothetical protein
VVEARMGRGPATPSKAPKKRVYGKDSGRGL